ncbi:MAG: 50S ribosomal protein L15 [Pseudomonadota bacterium]
MRLNTIKRSPGAKRPAKRLARGMGSGHGKTASRGHKGLKSRSGGSVSPGFEGGQMPLQRRLPKVGFKSRKARTSDEVRLHELSRVEGDTIDLEALRKAGLISGEVRRVKVIGTGSIDRAIKLHGIAATSGARKAIEAAGGSIEG